MTISKPISAGAALVLVAALGACATQTRTNTGFLGAPTAPESAAMAPVASPQSEPASFAAYSAVLIDAPVFRPGANTPDEIVEEDVAALLAAYQSGLESAFGARYHIVKEPGPGVMRVRSALTGYDFAQVGANILMTPVIGPVSNGGASSEAEVLDSVTGARVAALAEATNGSMFREGPLPYFSRRGHAERALRAHARILASRIPAPSGVSTADASSARP